MAKNTIRLAVTTLRAVRTSAVEDRFLSLAALEWGDLDFGHSADD